MLSKTYLLHAPIVEQSHTECCIALDGSSFCKQQRNFFDEQMTLPFLYNIETVLLAYEVARYVFEKTMETCGYENLNHYRTLSARACEQISAHF